MMICNTVQQGVLAAWLKWILFFVLSRRWSAKMVHTCVYWSKRKLGWASEDVSFEVGSHEQGPRLKEASAHFQARRGWRNWWSMGTF
jgi:hypothetical protein